MMTELQEPLTFGPEDAPRPPKGLYVALDPYPHLRDEDGCVLARDYFQANKLNFILQAVQEKIAADAAD